MWQYTDLGIDGQMFVPSNSRHACHWQPYHLYSLIKILIEAAVGDHEPLINEFSHHIQRYARYPATVISPINSHCLRFIYIHFAFI